MELFPLAWYHLIMFAVIVPLLALRSGRALRREGTPPRLKQYRANAVVLVLFGGLSWLTASAQQIDLFRIDVHRPLLSALIGIAFLIAAIAIMRPYWRTAVLERRSVVHLFMPQTRGERMWWVTLSMIAGVSEEMTWRGVQTALLALLTGSLLAGAALSAITFGVAHAIQGWRSAMVITAFALAFQGLVWFSGTLIVAMVVHALYDIVAGFTYSRLGRELGYTVAEPTGEAAA